MTRPRNFPGRTNTRRLAALERIGNQLLLGTKPDERSHPFHRRSAPLTADDRKRLQHEADTLTLRLVIDTQARAVRTKKTKALGWSVARAAHRSGKFA